jgi:hypothetical protein
MGERVEQSRLGFRCGVRIDIAAQPSGQVTDVPDRDVTGPAVFGDSSGKAATAEVRLPCEVI